MTVHAWSLTPKRVVVVSDTLVTEVSTGAPLRFASKVRTFPHIALAALGTGGTWPPMAVGFGVENYGTLAGGIDDAGQIEGYIGGLAAEHRARVLLFGWSREASGFTGKRLEEATGFKWATIPHGADFLPPCQGVDLPSDMPDAGLIKLAEALVDEVNAGSSGDPDDVGSCGGELILTELSAAGITQRKVKRFPNFEQLKGEIDGH